MNSPTPPPASIPPTRVVIKDNSLRTTLIAVAAGILVLVFVGYGVMKMGTPMKGNNLTGVITEKTFVPQKERRVSFSGRKLQGTKEIEGEYYFKVLVKDLNRTYDVPVDEMTYQSKKVGDSQSFLKPPSEQETK